MNLPLVEATLTHHGYRLVELLGTGGYAKIYKVWNDTYQHFYAAKIFAVESAQNIMSFTTEFNTLCSLVHPNIINIFGHFSDAQYLYIILEYMPNGSLCDLLLQRQCLQYSEIVAITRSLCEALRYCHGLKIAHKDIKPSNILFDPAWRIKLADFGLAQKTSQKILRFGGSLPFVSPEVVRRERHDPFKSDIWSLGITLFMAITGRTPWKSSTPERLIHEIQYTTIEIPDTIPGTLRDMISCMLTEDPNERPTINQIMDLPFFQNNIRQQLPLLSNPSAHRLPQRKSSFVNHVTRKKIGSKLPTTFLTYPRSVSPMRAGYIQTEKEKQVERI